MRLKDIIQGIKFGNSYISNWVGKEIKMQEKHHMSKFWSKETCGMLGVILSEEIDYHLLVLVLFNLTKLHNGPCSLQNKPGLVLMINLLQGWSLNLKNSV